MGQGAKVASTGVVLALAAVFILSQVGCGKSPTTPEPPPPPPTQYQHSFKVDAKTLHFGEAVTGTFTVKMLTNSKEFTANVGETATLDTTTKQQEACDIVINCTGCLTREFRNVSVSKNVLTTDVVKFIDIDIDYLLTTAMPHKDTQGRNLNTSWVPRILNASSNPDTLTGLRLDPIFFEGYWEMGKEYGIKPALLDFQSWGKRFAETTSEEVYITSAINVVDANNTYSGTPPPDGDYRVFRKSDTSGVTSITYPTSEECVMSSVVRIKQEEADPIAAYREALKALVAGNMSPVYLDKLRTCVPVLMWRPRNTNSYWITSTKESQEDIDTFSTFTTLSMSPAETNSLRASPAGTILGPGATSTGRPATARGSTAGPEKAGSSRPQTKERIRN